MQVEVFDPPMCCVSGVCGPTVDPALAQFAADLEWCKRQGATVTRYNLAQEPLAFARNDTVRAALDEEGEVLPLVLVNGQIVSRGKYPLAAELAQSLCVPSAARGDAPSAIAPEAAAASEPLTQSCCDTSSKGGNGAKCCG